MALPATDNFARGAQSDLGANWTDVYNGLSTTAGDQATLDVAADYNIALWNADSFNDDQYSQAVYVSGSFGGVAVRVSGSGGTRNAYYALVAVAGSRLSKVVNGSITDLIGSGSFPNPTAGQLIKITVTGDELEVFYDGVSQGTTTDASLTSGSAGLIGYHSGTVLMDDWEGGNIGGGGGGATVGKLGLLGVG
jgi:hypothetical protein